MGQTLAKMKEMKYKVNNTVAQLKGEEPETGYLGSPPVSFPKAVLPPDCKALDLRGNQGKIPEVIKVTIYECLDELKNDGSYRFSGVELIWRDKKTGQTQTIEQMSGEKDGCRTIEIGSLDYIKKVIFCTKEHQGVKYVSFCGVQSHLAEPAGVGELKAPVKECVSTNKGFTEGAVGLRLVVHKKLKVIVDVIAVYARVADKKTKVDETRKQVTHSFLTSYKDVQAIYGTKIYNYKGPENRYEDFSTFITNGKMREEYMGGLPIRFLAPEERTRLFALRDKLGLQPLFDLLDKKGSIYHLDLDPAMEEKVVSFILAILQGELFNQSGGDYETNIKFCLKMLCIVYNDNQSLWKKVVAKVEDSYKNIQSSLFDKAMKAVENDHNLKEVQKIEPSIDDKVQKLYQKACPQCPDDGKTEDLEKIAKLYMMDAAQYLQEFHTNFKSMFAKEEEKGVAEYHGAPSVKGLDRVKAKALENQQKEKLSASDAIARTMDYLRGTVECKDLHNVIMAYNKLKKLNGKDYRIVRVKNGFKDLSEKGFKSIMLNIMVYNTQIAEVQITIGAFKEGNTMNHFLYEVLREHSLYDIVAKNLNLSTAFKEWLEPLAPSSMHEIWPKNQAINLRGYCIEGADDFWSALTVDPKKKRYCNMNLHADKDYKLKGSFGWVGGQFKLIEGQSKVKFPTKLTDASKNLAESLGVDKVMNDKLGIGKSLFQAVGADKAVNKLMGEASGESSIEWRMLPYGSMERIVGIFKGKFLDDQIIEGEYTFKPCDNFGKETNGPVGYTCPKGTFRLWVDDPECPGLNASLQAFKDVMKNSKTIRKKFIPSKEMEWTGYLGGSKEKKDEIINEPLSLKLKVQNPKNFPYQMGISGKGTLGKAKFSSVAGYHKYYDSASLNLNLAAGSGGCFSFSGARQIVCTGRFIEDLKIVGSYDDRGHLGRFMIECTNKDAVKQFGTKSENASGRWELIIIYNDGEKQFNQLTMKIDPEHNITGAGNNFEGDFQITGKSQKKAVSFTRTQKGVNGIKEELTFDGTFITGGLYEGQFRSSNDWGKFKLRAC